MSAFIHLHTHSEFSLVDSILRVGDLVQFAKTQHAEAIALTDRNNLYGAVQFYKKATAAGIKPIIGCDLTVRDEQGNCDQLILLAQNNQGLTHLYELVSEAYLHDHQEQVAVNIDRFTPTQCAGLIALSGGLEGDIGRLVTRQNLAQAKERVAFWQNIFADRYYLQIACHGKPEENQYIAACQEIGLALNIAAVATNLACFSSEEDFEAHEVRVCIASGQLLENPDRAHFFNPHYNLRSSDEMAAQFAGAPQLLANSYLIAQRCNVTLTLGKNYLPDFPVPIAGMDENTYLIAEAKKGLEARLQADFPNANEREAQRTRYEQRLEKELSVINEMGFPGYFLIVADFIQWAKDQKIPVGPGRGSGAGSLVAYALKITDLDPLLYDLFFERFLNPERVSMPDFDIDFCMDRRDEVIHYVAQKYGLHRVSQIATHGTMAAKAVLRDVGRVLGMPYGQVDRIAKTVPTIPGVGLKDALGWSEKSKTKTEVCSPELLRIYEDDQEAHELIDMALKLEGLARNVGKHAGGVVIAPTKLTDFSALYSEQVGAGISTQYDKDDIEAVGLVKFDFLGLRNLTVIDWALEHINRRRAREGKDDLDISQLPLDDRQTYALLHSTKTTAVFQLESGGMKNVLGKLKPDNFEEIIALVALFRPGPLGSGMVDDFIQRKHGHEKVTYPHPELEPVLSTTYGVMVYQEQVMQVAQILANYSLGEADNLRRAMGKKKEEEMRRNRDIFVNRAIERGIDGEQAGQIFALMEKFAEYGFNKSHSAAYALITYQTAWLKAHYPAELMAAVLTSEMEKIEKIVLFVNEALDMGLTIIPPCVNRSQYTFTVNEAGAIVYGLGAVKGVGENAVKILITERERGGEFTSLLDLCRRLDLRKINRKTLETLICSGSFDFLGENRGALLAAMPQAVALAEQHHRNQAHGQSELFGLFDVDDNKEADVLLKLDPKNNWDDQMKLSEEKRTLGLFLSDHPINSVRAEIEQICPLTLSEALEKLESYGSNTRDKIPMTLAGVVIDVRKTISKKKKQAMMFVTLDDRTQRIEVAIFGEELIEQYQDICCVDRVLIMRVTAEYRYFQEQWGFSATEVFDFYENKFALARELRLKIFADDRNEEKISALWHGLHALLRPSDAPEMGTQVYIELIARDIGARGVLSLSYGCHFDRAGAAALEDLLKAENVQWVY